MYRSDENKVFAGILGGFGDYFGVDPALLRAAFLLVAVFTGFLPGIVAYILMTLVVPSSPDPKK